MPTPTIRSALEAYERAHADLFGQCAGNPIRNFRNQQVDMTSFNEAHRVAQEALREPERQSAFPTGWADPHWGREQPAAKPVPYTDTATPSNEDVICPACSHQFRAIPVQVQQLLLAAGYEPPFLGEPGAPAAHQCLPSGWSVERGTGVIIVNGPGTRTAMYDSTNQTIEGNTLRRLCQDALAHQPAQFEARGDGTTLESLREQHRKEVEAQLLKTPEFSTPPPGWRSVYETRYQAWAAEPSAAERAAAKAGTSCPCVPAGDGTDASCPDANGRPLCAQPAPVGTSERTDAALGLVKLPDIRVEADVALYLKSQAHNRGVIVQAHVRDLLSAVHQSNAPARPAEPDLSELDPYTVQPPFEPAAGPEPSPPSDQHSRRVSDEVLAERLRQVSEEDYRPEHDDEPDHAGQLERAAASYAISNVPGAPPRSRELWPWDWDEFKPTTHRRNLVRAAALLLAAIERCDRHAEQAQRGA